MISLYLVFEFLFLFVFTLGFCIWYILDLFCVIEVGYDGICYQNIFKLDHCAQSKNVKRLCKILKYLCRDLIYL